MQSRLPRSAHTVLINCAIGFCQQDSRTWIHPLSTHKYEPALVEQTITLTEGGHVRPDVVAHSNSLNHSILFDCKGGTSVDEAQIDRYQLLKGKEMRNYIKLYDPNQYRLDVCIVDFQRTHQEVTKHTKSLPCLTIAPNHLTKSGEFKKAELNKTFASDIPIPEDNLEPSSYYPFSENDSQFVIIKEVIRAWLVILLDRRMKDKNVLAKETYADSEVMKVIHPWFDIMEPEHQRALTQRVLDIIAYLGKEYNEITNQVFDIQNLRFEEADIHVRLGNLRDVLQPLIDKEEEKMGLEAFWPEPSRKG